MNSETNKNRNIMLETICIFLSNNPTV